MAGKNILKKLMRATIGATRCREDGMEWNICHASDYNRFLFSRQSYKHKKRKLHFFSILFIFRVNFHPYPSARF
jgi:hypothetical protein